MSLWQIIGSIAGVLSAIGAGALGGYLFYKRKHPIDVEAGKIQNNVSWLEMVAKMRHELDEMHSKQNDERTECDAKIDQLRDDFRKEITQLEARATKAEKQAEENLDILRNAQEKCVDGCFRRA